MAIDERDVRQVAGLARLGVDDARIADLAAQLRGILAHMDVLQQVDVSAAGAAPPPPGMPLRDDVGPGHALARPRDAFAPRTYDGFFLVPRLATHETADE
ncbi:MAG: aspartyl/glutamyl-tRNA amidotransferase subunit C [Gemmatimonadota bacterium]